MKKIIFIAIIFFTQILFAQQFRVSTDKTTVEQNERFQIYYEFDATDLNAIKSFRPPSFKGLNVISGPNQSTSMQIINGQMSASITFSFILYGQNVGTFTIGPATIIYQGKEYSSGSLTINVTKSSGAKTNPGASNTQSDVSMDDIAKNVFIIASTDKSTAYKGEQILVTYKLYTKLDISSPQISKLPTYKDFWAEEIETGNNIQLNIEMYKGERYRTAILKKVALFPTSTGNLSVTPFELNIPVIITRKRVSRDIFDEFFNDPFFQRRETVEFLARSNKLTINVKSLPSDNVPKSFNGAVGNYKLSTEVNKTDIKTNESVTYKINLSGTGNIKLVNIPEINFPTGIDKYDPKINESISSKGIISGTKSIEYLIIPRISGKIKIPGFDFSYFNPTTKSYVTININDITLNVKKGVGDAEVSGDYFDKEEIKLLSKDIRFIKTNEFDLIDKNKARKLSWLFYAGILLPIVLFVSTLLIVRKNQMLSKNSRVLKFIKAEKIAKKRLREAELALKQKNHSVFYDEIAKALQGYLEDKLGIIRAEFTKEFALKVLEEKNVDMQIQSDVKNILEKCEYMKYAPATDNNVHEDFYKKTLNTILLLEDFIEGKKK